MSLYLIRHGETAWSLSGQHTGRTDIPLTARGDHEAQAFSEGLPAVTFDRVFTSPRQRARRTCALVGQVGSRPDPQARDNETTPHTRALERWEDEGGALT